MSSPNPLSDPEYDEHSVYHKSNPSMNCGYCAQDADTDETINEENYVTC